MYKELEKTREETLHLFALPEPHLKLQYHAHSWSIRQILHHIADAESVLLHRIKRVISGESLVWAFDQDAWNHHLNYLQQPLSISEALYTASRQSICWCWEQAYDDSEKVTFIHSETGHRTLRQEFDKVLWHNRHHLDQIEKALSVKA